MKIPMAGKIRTPIIVLEWQVGRAVPSAPLDVRSRGGALGTARLTCHSNAIFGFGIMALSSYL